MVQSAFEHSPDAQPGETGVYRRSDIEEFSKWARTTIDRLQRELVAAQGRAADAEWRATAAEKALADRQELEDLLVKAADQAADAAAVAAVARVEALLDEARAKADAARDAGRHEPAASHLFDREADQPSAPATFDDPVRDPLPPWNERLLAFPDEHSDLPPIGPIFERDTHHTA